VNLLRYDYWLDLHAPWRLALLCVVALLIALVWRRRRAWPIALGLHTLATLVTLVNMPRFAPAPVITALALMPLLVVGLALWQHDRHSVRALLPLCFAYAATLLNALRIDLSALGALNGVLSPPVAWLVCGGCALALATRSVCANDARFVRYGALTLAAATLLWSVYAAALLRTHGVTGSDPYAYAQMGVDLAERGTLAHAFPLIEQTYALNIASYPVVHTGYRLPSDARRIAPTVWPPGYALFTAAAWRIGGEGALYWLTPLLALAALLVIGAVARRLAHQIVGAEGAWAVAALSILISATSLEQITWQMLPMADIAAQLFSWLALGCALWRPTRRAPLAALLSGIALGIAFDVRYTQVLIAPALALALGLRRTPAEAIRAVAVCAGAALLCALPIFVYHNTWFGGPLQTGSDELQHFAWANLLPMARMLVAAWLNVREFGLLLVPILIGAWALLRRDKAIVAVLLTFCAPLLLLHLLYAYLRPRDLLTLFPLLAVLAALGCVALWQWMARRARLARACIVGALCFALVLRSMQTLALPASGGFTTFGYLLREQRASFDAIAAATEPNAVIGASLHSGALDLHAYRLAFRPADWPPAELDQFIAAMQTDNRPVYVLIDGDALAALEPGLRARYATTEIGAYALPYFQTTGGGSINANVRLLKLSSKAIRGLPACFKPNVTACCRWPRPQAPTRASPACPAQRQARLPMVPATASR
jgi:hypothetical protein